MESLAEQLIFSTIFLNGQAQNNDWISATGFIFNHNNHFYLVTNRHVVKAMTKVKGYLPAAIISKNKRQHTPGQMYSIELEKLNFTLHPNPTIDVAVIRITDLLKQFENDGNRVYLKSIKSNNIPNKQHIEKFIGPIEDVLIIGYPGGIFDNKNSTPIVRKGITATPYYQDFDGEPKFLIDSLSVNGSSGSPVFIYYSGSHPDRQGNWHEGNKFFFLGINSTGIVSGNLVNNQGTASNDKDHPQLPPHWLGLGIVYKATTIMETVEAYIRKHGL